MRARSPCEKGSEGEHGSWAERVIGTVCLWARGGHEVSDADFGASELVSEDVAGARTRLAAAPAMRGHGPTRDHAAWGPALAPVAPAPAFLRRSLLRLSIDS